MRIALLGDLAFLGKYDLSQSDSAFQRLSQVKKKLSEYDFVIGNLESPLTTKKRTIVCKSIHLKTSPVNVELLKFIGVTNVSLANNHILDFGNDGLKETIRVLDSNGIKWFGFKNRYNKLERGEDTVNCSAFCCYSTNGIGLKENGKVNLLCDKSVSRQLQIDEQEKSISLLLTHWGEEHTHFPMHSTIEIAHAILNKRKGTIICGAHPHCMQGIEPYNNGYVAYSLGNFIFDDVYSINKKFSVKQTEENRKTFLWDLEFKDGCLTHQHPVFFFDGERGLVEGDYSVEMDGYSKKLSEHSQPDYQRVREEERQKYSIEKIGRKDFQWFFTRLNYYSIGAKLLVFKNRRMYTKIYKGFLAK